MKDHRRAIAMAIIICTLMGCGSNPQLGMREPPSFTKGLAAIERNDFAAASFHFAELAKEGNPESMNNLGVALLMVDRKDEAIYWFKKASRYGEPNAKSTLEAMGENVPPSDLVGQHPTQLQQEAAKKIIVNTLIGVAIGVSAYYVSQGFPNHYHPHASSVNGIKQNIGAPPIGMNSLTVQTGNTFPRSAVYGQEYIHGQSGTSYSNIGGTIFGTDGASYTRYGQEYLHGQSGTSYSNIGGTIFGTDGTSYTRIGNTTFGSNGNSSIRIGNSSFDSDGSSSTQIGNFLFNSDGSSINRIGNTTFGSDGTTCNKIGNSTFCN